MKIINPLGMAFNLLIAAMIVLILLLLGII